MTLVKNAAKGTAHGKIILIGEHAVVYDMPAIALPFTTATITVEVSSYQGKSYLESACYCGSLDQAPGDLAGLQACLTAVCADLDQSSDHLYIKVDSMIPAERGMGSSAAVATALVKALFHYFQVDLSNEALSTYVQIAEKITHGNPSGLDATVVNSIAPVYFKRNQVPKAIPLNVDGYLIAADTGIKGHTKEAVGDVAKLVETAKVQTMDIVHHLGQLTHQAKKAIMTNNLPSLGDILNQSHQLLRDLTVSNPNLDQLVQVAQDAGAYGAKLTGGGRGGCMIALAQSGQDASNIAKELEKAGAIETWIHPLGVASHD